MDTGGYNTVFIERECRRCGHRGIPTPSGKIDAHHGHELRCTGCGMFLAWGGKSKQVKSSSGKRELSTQWTAKRLGIDYCQLCRKEKVFVDACGEKLEAHHLIPIASGGEDAPHNILILCTECHRIVHHRITYGGHYRAFFDAWTKLRGLNEAGLIDEDGNLVSDLDLTAPYLKQTG